MDRNSQVARKQGVWPTPLESNHNLPQHGGNLPPPPRTKQQLERRRRINLRGSLTSLKDFYNQDLDTVRADGFEPRRLIQGVDISRDGPNAPPRSFWVLLTVRDRIILEANELLAITEERSPTFFWSIRFIASIPFALGLVSLFTWFKSRFGWLALPFAGTSIFLVAYRFWNSSRNAAMWSPQSLKSLVAKVTNWEYVEPRRGQSMNP